MIVNEDHRYVFIQFPQAASTAIGNELVEHYGGRRILRKHSMYHHFERWAGSSAGEYYAFSSIRNPLEKQVSLYHKFRTNHLGHFTDPEAWKRNGGWITEWERRRFRYVHDRDATFEEFFRRFFWLPYVDWSVLDHKDMDFVIRYESLQEDFSRALEEIGLERVRPLPRRNPTSKDRRDLSSYYSASLGRRACWVMGPILDYWGYAFPEAWPCRESSALSRAGFHAVKLAKALYYRYVW